MSKANSYENSIAGLIKKARYQDAIDLSTTALDVDHNNHSLFFLKAVAHIYMNRINEALLDLGEAIYLNPGHVPTMLALAFVFIKQGDFEGAINKWITVLERDSKNKIAKKNLELFKKNAPNKATINLNPDLYLEVPEYIEQKVKKN